MHCSGASYCAVCSRPILAKLIDQLFLVSLVAVEFAIRRSRSLDNIRIEPVAGF